MIFNIYKIDVFNWLVARRDLGLHLNKVKVTSEARKSREMPRVPRSETSCELGSLATRLAVQLCLTRGYSLCILTQTVGTYHAAAIQPPHCVLFCRAVPSCSCRRLSPPPAWVLVSHFRPSLSLVGATELGGLLRCPHALRSSTATSLLTLQMIFQPTPMKTSTIHCVCHAYLIRAPFPFSGI